MEQFKCKNCEFLMVEGIKYKCSKSDLIIGRINKKDILESAPFWCLKNKNIIQLNE